MPACTVNSIIGPKLGGALCLYHSSQLPAMGFDQKSNSMTEEEAGTKLDVENSMVSASTRLNHLG